MKKIRIVFLFITLVIVLTSCLEEVYEPGTVTKENVTEYLYEYSVTTKEFEPVKGEIPRNESGKTSDGLIINYELPDVNNYELSVVGNGELNVEIFLPIENFESAILECISGVTEKFNKAGITVDGKSVSVSIRALEASLAEEYILSGTYYPKGYIAANELYGLLMQENGIDVKMLSPKTVGNTMGIAIANEKYEELEIKYGGEDIIKSIIDACQAGELSIGYSNPTNNPTGLNFVISMLSYFDANNPTSVEATTDFSKIKGAVSFRTEQMEASITRAYVTERQLFEAIQNDGLTFIPFGVRQDNPLYAVGEVTSDELEILNQFSEYFNLTKINEYKKQFGFEKDENYQSIQVQCDGNFISTVLSAWKSQRAENSEISVIFVADISGSMRGDKIEKLQESLLNAMQYIGESTKVGLVSFDSDVYINLKIKEFDTEQQEYFAGAVSCLKAGGSTATNDAIIIANRMLLEQSNLNSNEKPLIILLSDGETCYGYSLDSIEEVINVLDVPIYTIGYGEDVDENELRRISDINNGVYIKADNDEIAYYMKLLFNAEG